MKEKIEQLSKLNRQAELGGREDRIAKLKYRKILLKTWSSGLSG